MKARNFYWLLWALLVFLIVAPVAEDLGVISTRLMRVTMFCWLLTFGVWSLRGFGLLFPIGIGFAVAGNVLSIAAASAPGELVAILSLVTTAGFVAISAWCVGSQVLLGREINANRVTGAVTLYLLFGVLWAIAYAVVEKIAAGSFRGLSQPMSSGWGNDWLYFSFVTMTTLGYGDIVPVAATARTLAYLQAVFGQFYLAILVAGLVSAYMARRSGGAN